MEREYRIPAEQEGSLIGFLRNEGYYTGMYAKSFCLTDPNVGVIVHNRIGEDSVRVELVGDVDLDKALEKLRKAGITLEVLAQKSGAVN